MRNLPSGRNNSVLFTGAAKRSLLTAVSFSCLSTCWLPGAIAQTPAPAARVAPAKSQTATTAKPHVAAGAAAAARPAPAAKPAGDADSKPADQAAPAEPVKSVSLPEAVKNYRAKPDAQTWDEVWKSVSQLLKQPAAIKTSAPALIANNPGLKEIGARVIDAEGGRVWTFPQIPECQSVMVQWQSTVATTVEKAVHRRGRTRVVKAVSFTPVSRAQAINLSKIVSLSDAHLVQGSAGAAAAKDGKKAPAPAPVSARYLVLAGRSEGSGAVWLQGYKLTSEGFVESPDLFSALPPFLTQNINGRVSFSGNDLVFDVTGKDGEARSSAPIKGKMAPASSGYRIVLKLIGGHYTLGGKNAEDAPALVAVEFMQAVQQGRGDVAKGWLVDANLLSITKYVGLLGHPATQSRMIAMASPGAGLSRFRFITYQKNDLILDIGRVKKQLAVKALFIAPPDPLAQKLAGSLPGTINPEKAVETPASEEAEKDGGKGAR